MAKKGMLYIISMALSLFLFVSDTLPVLARESNVLTNLIQIVYNDQNGLPTSEANTVLQTRDGYIWIGGYGGLVRYDGREFRNYSTLEGGLTTSGIRALFEDSHGRLWIGTNDKGVFLYENGTFRACVMPEGDLYQSIRCFAQDENGTLFIGTSTGLLKMEENHQLSPIQIDSLEGQTIYSLSFDENNVLWGTAGSGFAFAVKDGNLAYWFKPGDLNPNENYAVLAYGNIIYIGTNGNALLKLTLMDDRYEKASYHLAAYSIGPLRTVNALYVSKKGELWVGCNTGSGWFDKEMELHLLDDMEQNTFISCITQDYEGNLWMSSTQGGVFQLAQGKFLNANKTAGLAGKSINAVVKLDGLLYAASDYGLFIVDEAWNPVVNEVTKQLNNVRIRHLCADSSGNLWISTYSNWALLCYSPKTESLLSITKADGLLSNKVREVIQLENGDMAVATTAGVCIIRDRKVIEAYGQEQGLNNPVVLCLLQMSDGTLLAGSDGMGIYAIKNGKTVNYSKEQGLDTGVVLRMREDQKADGVWISAGSSLYFMDSEGGIREITQFRYGIGSVFDIQVMEDAVWFIKSSGVIMVSRSALLGQEEMAAIQYDRQSGLTANLTANSWNLYEDGILYLCSVNGIFLLDNRTSGSNSIPPKIAIDEITVQQDGGKTTVYQSPAYLALPWDTKRVTIRFACLSFAGAPGRVSYYLENFDEQVVESSAEQAEAASYTNLRGGDYIFHLNAENADGMKAGTGLTVVIHKEPKLLERPVVWLLLIVLVILCGIFLSKLILEWKTRQLKRKQEEYKEITDQALKTIANTIDAKDPYTKGHSIRVAGYSMELARRMGLSQNEQENIYYIALLHDIGKIGIPDAILNKPGKLTDEEFDIMRKHTRIGGDILKDFTALPQIGEGALSHHENYDGSGYPEHRDHEDIPMVARIIRAADSYDAMATQRSYRDGMNKEYILSEFEKFSGLQFEPQIAQLMVEMITDGFTIEETESK